MRPSRRREFTHPDLPIDRGRLLAVLADGRAADSALFASLGDPRNRPGGGREAELHDEIRAVQETAARHGTIDSPETQERLANLRNQLTTTRRQETEARQSLIARREQANRCARYALERGHQDPELTAYAGALLGQNWEVRT